MRILKRLVKAVFIIISIGVIGSTINHYIKLQKEETMQVRGNLVEVNGHKMNVYIEGEGKETLVFMSGSGTCSPVLDFKTLYSKLSKEYKIAVVEKAGYGFSEVANVSRDIDTILEETRLALKKTRQNPPYILVPHSMSGLEALYWAQKYPKEVKAIIGLDPAVPPVYDEIQLPSTLNMGIQYLGARIGLTRFIPSICENSAAIKSGDLTDEEKAMYCTLTHQKTLTKNMLDEIKSVKANQATVAQGGVPVEIPMYFFISDGKELGCTQWRKMLTTYCTQLKHGKYMYLECGHYMQDEAADIIAMESKEFIKELN